MLLTGCLPPCPTINDTEIMCYKSDAWGSIRTSCHNEYDYWINRTKGYNQFMNCDWIYQRSYDEIPSNNKVSQNDE